MLGQLVRQGPVIGLRSELELLAGVGRMTQQVELLLLRNRVATLGHVEIRTGAQDCED